MPMWSRRVLLLSAAALAPLAGARTAAGPVLVMRHAQTDPGVGDPPGFVLHRCATQRNLSAEGRAQARAFGTRLAALGLRPTAIRSSRWCRCLHTGDEIGAGLGSGAPKTEAWPALDSFFEDRAREPAQTASLRERLAALSASRGFELWVTHQVNITALTGGFAAMGQAAWVTARADRSLATTPFD
jgi:phosphohistidine phosphatase SixA